MTIGTGYVKVICPGYAHSQRHEFAQELGLSKYPSDPPYHSKELAKFPNRIYKVLLRNNTEQTLLGIEDLKGTVQYLIEESGCEYVTKPESPQYEIGDWVRVLRSNEHPSLKGAHLKITALDYSFSGIVCTVILDTEAISFIKTERHRMQVSLVELVSKTKDEGSEIKETKVKETKPDITKSVLFNETEEVLMKMAETREIFTTRRTRQEAREILLYRAAQPKPEEPKHPDVQKAIDSYPSCNIYSPNWE